MNPMKLCEANRLAALIKDYEAALRCLDPPAPGPGEAYSLASMYATPAADAALAEPYSHLISESTAKTIQQAEIEDLRARLAFFQDQFTDL
jgi:hypothetical protein